MNKSADNKKMKPWVDGYCFRYRRGGSYWGCSSPIITSCRDREREEPGDRDHGNESRNEIFAKLSANTETWAKAVDTTFRASSGSSGRRWRNVRDGYCGRIPFSVTEPSGGTSTPSRISTTPCVPVPPCCPPITRPGTCWVCVIADVPPHDGPVG